MHLKHLLVVPAAAALITVAGMAPASAGETTGNGGTTQAPAHTNSICAFSGLEDGSEGTPAGPGAPPQNWGHDKEAFGATPAERKASGFQPGDSCNGHTGFLAGGGGEPPA